MDRSTRTFAIILLVASGTAFAYTFGSFLPQELVPSSDPFQIVFIDRTTDDLPDNSPTGLHRLTKHVLWYMSFSPLAILSGLAASFALNLRAAILGVVFWIAFAISGAALLSHQRPYWTGVTGDSFFPESLGMACTIPLYLTGVFVAKEVASRRLPTFAIVDLLLATAVYALLSLASLAERGNVPPLCFSIICVLFLLRSVTPLAARPKKR